MFIEITILLRTVGVTKVFQKDCSEIACQPQNEPPEKVFREILLKRILQNHFQVQVLSFHQRNFFENQPDGLINQSSVDQYKTSDLPKTNKAADQETSFSS